MFQTQMANMHEDRKLLEAPIRGGLEAYLCVCHLLIEVVPDKVKGQIFLMQNTYSKSMVEMCYNP